MKRFTPRLIWSLLLSFLAASLFAQGETYFAGDLHYRGLLGANLKIEMLIPNEGVQVFSSASGQCFDIHASYFYRTQLKDIQLQGRFCPANRTFFLADKEGDEERERFEGKWDPTSRKLSGNWTLKSSGKILPFELTPLDAGVPTAHFQKFFAFLQAQLKSEPDAEGATIQSASWTSQGGRINGFEPNWGGAIEFLSPMRFQYYTSYTSTARSSYYINVYQLLPTSKGLLIMELHDFSNYNKPYADEDHESEDEDEDAENSCTVDITISRYQNGEFEDVTAEILPKGLANSISGSGTTSCVAQILSDGILFHDGKKAYWNGTAFEQK